LNAVPFWLGPTLIALSVVAFFITPMIIFFLLIVGFLVSLLAGVYYAFKHGQLQKAVAKIDAAGAALAASPATSSANIIDGTLDSNVQVLIPQTVAAAKATSTTPAK
jgi:hypothetical protein